MMSAADFQRRVFARPLRQRFFQVANAAIALSAGRAMGISHVVEFPKSGGSWLRNMLQQAIGGKPHLHHSGIVRPGTVVQVHRLYHRMYCRPIVMVRDPRDVMVSFYYHSRRDPVDMPSPGFLHDPSISVHVDFARFVAAKYEQPGHPPFRFCDFVNSWVDRPEVCLVRYEDLLDSPEDELARVLRFIGHDDDRQQIAAIVEHHSFANATRRRTGVVRKRGQEDASSFERKGISGDWRNHFTAASCDTIQCYETKSLHRLGYVEGNSWVADFLAGDQMSD